MGFRTLGIFRGAYLFSIVLSAWLLGPFYVLIDEFTTDVVIVVTTRFTSGVDWLSFDSLSIYFCNRRSKGSKYLLFSRK